MTDQKKHPKEKVTVSTVEKPAEAVSVAGAEQPKDEVAPQPQEQPQAVSVSNQNAVQVPEGYEAVGDDGSIRKVQPDNTESEWPKKVRTTMRPDEEIEVDKTEYEDLKFSRLLVEN